MNTGACSGSESKLNSFKTGSSTESISRKWIKSYNIWTVQSNQFVHSSSVSDESWSVSRWNQRRLRILHFYTLLMFSFLSSLYSKGAYYSQPVFAQPHVIHHTTVVQPNSLPSAIYPAPVPAARPNSVPVGMLSGSTMAMSAGKGWFYADANISVSMQ